jgi:hypothetical protein
MIRNSRQLIVVSSLTIASVFGLSGCMGSGPDTSGPANAQGWTPGNQRFFYEISQGSRMMPSTWYAALEQPGTSAPFSDQQYIASFGYIKSGSDRKENLPVGFATDQQSDEDFVHTKLKWYDGQKNGSKSAEPWMGINCAACHTAEITYKGEAFRIEGGPSMGDFQAFVVAVNEALRQTSVPGAKFDRFAAKVLAGKNTPDNQNLLRKALADLVAWQNKAEKINGDNGVVRPYGYARLDAFGHIYNKVALFNNAPVQPGNLSDAPVSYPFLWDISLHDRVQWNGVVKNQRIPKTGKNSVDVGALGRNAGEVIGVFGEVVIPPPKGNGIRSYKSSLQISELDKLEVVVAQLKAPIWPAKFGPIKDDVKAQGKIVYDRLNCVACHTDRATWKPGQPFEVMTPLKNMGPNLTDIWMACNAVTYLAPSGNMLGGKAEIFKGTPMPTPALLFNQLQFIVKTSLVGKGKDILERVGAVLLGIEGKPVLNAQDDANMTFEEAKIERGKQCVSGEGMPPEVMQYLAYKGRPLDGIWATAPYLHNGSVPTLYHMLVAPADRPKVFYVGSHEYDVEKVGYVWKDPPAGPSSKFEVVGAGGKPVFGNSNGGHDYGVGGLNEPDRLALLEYLKSL